MRSPIGATFILLKFWFIVVCRKYDEYQSFKNDRQNDRHSDEVRVLIKLNEMRNPNWTEEEIILALDLYFDMDFGQMNKTNERVIELSNLLNQLPFHSSGRDEKFRNPNGVAMRLNNFKTYDDQYEGVGLKGGGSFVQSVFEKFDKDRSELNRRALQIKSLVDIDELPDKLRTVSEDEVQESASEGKLIFRLHKVRERSGKLSRQKKEAVLKANGNLECEVCSFDFKIKYGDLGIGFCEVHHRKPLSELDGAVETTLDDLAIVCANCHRMLHRMEEMSISRLKAMLNS